MVDDGKEEDELTETEWLEVGEIRDKLLNSVANLDPDEVSDFSKWYAGITGNVIRRFVEHRLSEEKADLYEYMATGSQGVAEAVENVLQYIYGMEGQPGGGDGDANLVYVYKKAPHTVP